MNSEGNTPQTLEIRKYANRRYYDSTRSKHVTLEEIYDLICKGHDVTVADFKTGQDITPKVLAQIMLEQDPVKLDMFPSALLHLLIRTNEQIVTDFVDKYFNSALQAFLESQKQFETYLRQSLGLHGGPPTMPWGRGAMGGIMPPFWGFHGASGVAEPAEKKPSKAGPDSADESDNKALRHLVTELSEQVRTLREELDRPKHRRDRQ